MLPISISCTKKHDDAQHWEECVTTMETQPGTPVLCELLLLGISHFQAGITDLPGVVGDLQAWAALFQRHDQHLRGCRIRLVKDEHTDKASLSSIIRGWSLTISKQEKTTQACLWIATHGMYVNDAYHLCASDSRMTLKGPQQSIHWKDELCTWLKPLHHHPLTILLDCCRHRFSERSDDRAMSPLQREDIALTTRKWAVWSGCAYGQFAQESLSQKPSQHRGHFTAQLLYELERSLSIRLLRKARIHKHLRLRRLHRRVKSKLTTHKEQVLRQSPQLYTSDAEQDQRPLFQARPHKTSPVFYACLTLVIVFLLTIPFVPYASVFAPAPSKQDCRQCVAKRWMPLRKEQCRRASRFALFCSAPCNQAHIQTVTAGCRSRCPGPWLQQSLQRTIRQNRDWFDTTQHSQCTELIDYYNLAQP